MVNQAAVLERLLVVAVLVALLAAFGIAELAFGTATPLVFTLANPGAAVVRADVGAGAVRFGRGASDGWSGAVLTGPDSVRRTVRGEGAGPGRCWLTAVGVASTTAARREGALVLAADLEVGHRAGPLRIRAVRHDSVRGVDALRARPGRQPQPGWKAFGGRGLVLPVAPGVASVVVGGIRGPLPAAGAVEGEHAEEEDDGRGREEADA